MFSSIPGKHCDVQIFYDGGKSHCLFREGTPRNLWGCRMKKGPHPIGAVSATTIWGGDSWACQPMTSQGSREILIGIEVKAITTDFPMVDLQDHRGPSRTPGTWWWPASRPWPGPCSPSPCAWPPGWPASSTAALSWPQSRNAIHIAYCFWG